MAYKEYKGFMGLDSIIAPQIAEIINWATDKPAPVTFYEERVYRKHMRHCISMIAALLGRIPEWPDEYVYRETTEPVKQIGEITK